MVFTSRHPIGLVAVAATALAGLTATSQAFVVELGPTDLTEALDLGRTGIEARRTEFHRPYRLTVGQPPLDYVDVVTPFRRVVLAAEARLRAGERLFGQREALDVLGTTPEALDLRLELTFHPQNSFVAVPLYDIRLRGGADVGVVEPRNVERLARFGPRVEGVPQTSSTQGVGIARGATQPLLGGTIVASFDGRTLTPRGRYTIEVWEGRTLVTSGIVDFAPLR